MASSAVVLLSAGAAHAGVLADFDGDGRGDLAIGNEGEDLPAPIDCLNSGSATVIYGTNDGLDLGAQTGPQFWHEEVPGVRGNCTGDDGFGDAVAAGDFDGDGRADLAIGSTGDVVKGKQYAGSIRVLYGTNNGLKAAGDEMITKATNGVPGAPAEDDELGEALAAGDFNGDGRDDLAAQIYCQNVKGRKCAGALLLLRGSPGGLSPQGARLVTQATPGIAGTAKPFDQLGSALAAGELNGKGPDDLAIGTPQDQAGSFDTGGTVQVLFGSRGGLSKSKDLLIHEGKGSIFGDPDDGDRFGAALATGRVDGGKTDELAIGVPGDSGLEGGIAHLLFGSNQGPDPTETWSFSQGPDPVEGTPEEGDGFGSAVALGDFDGEERDDLAVGSPGDNEAGFNNAGGLNVFFSAGGLISVAGDQYLHQAVSSVPGVAAAFENFGETLAAGHLDNDAANALDLAVGVPADTVAGLFGAGSVHAFYGGGADGLDLVTDQLFNQALPGLGSDATGGEGFGDSLAAGW